MNRTVGGIICCMRSSMGGRRGRGRFIRRGCIRIGRRGLRVGRDMRRRRRAGRVIGKCVGVDWDNLIGYARG